MNLVIAILLVFVLGASAAVVFSQDPRRQVLALAVNGLVLGVLFLALQAPDVAYSEIVIGSIALPLFFLAALAALRAQDRQPDPPHD